MTTFNNDKQTTMDSFKDDQEIIATRNNDHKSVATSKNKIEE